MKRINILKIENYFEAFLLLTLGGLFIYLILDYVFPILLAAVFVFLTYKPHKYLRGKISESLSALILLIVVLFILLYPTFWIFNSLIAQTGELVSGSEDLINNIDLSYCKIEICERIERNIEFLDISFDNIYNRLFQYFSSSFNTLFSSITGFFVNLFVFILAYFYLLKDGDEFLRYIKRIIPMKPEYKNALLIKFRDVSLAVFINTIFVAIMQGTLVAIGFWIAGIKAPLFWGVIASFAALLPIFGPALVWVPATLVLLLSGNIGYGIFLLIWGLIVVSLSDNIIRPLLLKRTVKVHEFLILLSILGGIEVFGFLLGIFIGPMIISLLIAVLNLYGLDFTYEVKEENKAPKLFK